MKIICKLSIPHNILALANPSLSYHLKLCAAFSVFVTETQVDTEKSPISKKNHLHHSTKPMPWQ